MPLLEDRRNYAQEQQEKRGAKFWQEYFRQETQFYRQILTSKPRKSTVKSYAKKFGVDLITMTGFLDGINDSLKNPNQLENLEPDSEVSLGYDTELLYKNMVEAKAHWLYSLTEWENHLSLERRQELYREQRNSKTVVKGPKTGRNEPCPCGSGKKYKKCCGRDA